MPTDGRYCAAVAGGVNAYTDGFMENGVGIDDFMALCAEVGVIPALTIRFQFGGAVEVQEASDWVEYMNGAASTTWGALRAERGHMKPYGVSYWSVCGRVCVFAFSFCCPDVLELSACVPACVPPQVSRQRDRQANAIPGVSE